MEKNHSKLDLIILFMFSKHLKNNKTAVIFSVGIAVFVFAIASLVSYTSTNTLSEAAWPNSYPPRLSLSCQDCSANGLNRLCFNRLRKTSFCTSAPINDPNSSCVSCPLPPLTKYPTRYPTMTSYPRVTPTFYPRPTCIPLPPDCGTKLPDGSIIVCDPPPGGWYCPGPTTPYPSCVPPPPCVYSEPFCGGVAPPPGGWCPQPTPTIVVDECVWCGSDCVNGPLQPDQNCNMALPPNGYVCKRDARTGTCRAINETGPYPSPYPTRPYPACRSYGSCANDQPCPAGTECSGIPVYGCYPPGCTYPICLSSTTTISTPNGEVKVTDLKPDMLVWSVTKDGQKAAVPLVKVSRSPVGTSHKMVHIVLADGRELSVSTGHPTADGRTVDQLKAGDRIDGSLVKSVETVPYADTFTYDILPDSDTGFYFADGILIGSTLK